MWGYNLPMKQEITPVILCGGSGTRLWPLSRKSYPKQFSQLLGHNTLFQQSALRVASSEIASFRAPVVVTNSDFRFIAAHQLELCGVQANNILIEPEAKNTAPAILAAALLAHSEDKHAVLLVTPSDHVIPDTLAFHQAVSAGLNAVSAGRIVTFGIQPNRPETGYGYLEVSSGSGDGAIPLNRFVEKPEIIAAQEMLDAGHYYWNAGIFLFRARDMLAAFTQHCPEILNQVTLSVENGKKDLDFFRLDTEAWKNCDSASIDYAIMEKVNNLSVVPYKGKWSDLGGWDAIWREMDPNGDGVSLSDNAHAIDCSDTLLRSESEGQEIVGIGLTDIIAVAMPDAVLVAHKSRAQDVKKAVDVLRVKGLAQAETFPKDHRPWGWFETLAISDRFQVKRIYVHPGAALSLQSHHHRSEHWVVVKGTAKVTVNDEVRLIGEGASVYIPLGAVHRMENPGKLPMVLIEVQTGPYLGEDDIVRYEDIYART